MPMSPFRLPDGRSLDLCTSGPEDGTPFVWFHGTPGAYLPSPELERAVHAHGFRWVSWSRPGYGDSTRQPGRTVADVVDDARAVLAGLGATRCAVGGRSGGGPHALACAALLAEAAAVVVLAGVAPYEAEGLDFLAGQGQDNIDEFGAALEGEEALRRWMAPQAEALAAVTPEQIVGELDSLLPDVDRAVLTGARGQELAAAFHEAVRTGIDGWVDDDLAFTRPWGFDLAAIRTPVSLWQGSADLMVPFAHGRWLAERVPGAEAHLVDGEGHMSIAHSDEDTGRILDTLRAALPA